MQQVWTTKVGPPETLTVKEAPDPTLQPGQVKIRVRAAGVNFADVMARLGLYPDSPPLPAVLGYEVSGVVEDVSGETGCRAGQKVIGLCRFGGHSDVVTLPAVQVVPMPDHLTFEMAAALPVNYLTAYQMLFVMGSIRADDTVLVHSAGGGVGLAAIDLIKIAGGKVIGTASAAKHEFLKGRGVDFLVDYRTADFESEVKKITGSRGVQIALDAAGGDSWTKSFRCLGPTGRLVIFGFSSAVGSKKRSIARPLKAMLQVPWVKLNPFSLMNENKAVVGVNLGHLWDHTSLTRSWLEQILRWTNEGKIRPRVAETFRFAEAARAHHYIQDRKNIGKVILVP